MQKIKLYTEPKKYIVIEVATEEQAKEVEKLNRALWRQAKSDKKEIAVSRYERKSAESDGEDSSLLEKIKDEDPTPEERYIEREDHQEKDRLLLVLGQAVKTLKPEQQEIIRMAFTENKSHAEIGQALGISKQAIQQRMETIIKKLKTFF